MTTASRQVFNVDEVAAILGVCSRTVRKMVKRGEVPSIRLGRKLGIPEPALTRWLTDPTTNKSAAE